LRGLRIFAQSQRFLLLGTSLNVTFGKRQDKNPPLGAMLLYLRAWGASWVEFFRELSD